MRIQYVMYNSQFTIHNVQRAYGVWYGLKEYVRTYQFVQNPIGRFVICDLYIVN